MEKELKRLSLIMTIKADIEIKIMENTMNLIKGDPITNKIEYLNLQVNVMKKLLESDEKMINQYIKVSNLIAE